MSRPLTAKTIADLMQDVRGQAHHFVVKYERSIYDRRSTPEMLRFYRQCKDTYYELFAVLEHLNSYNHLIDRDKCLSCKNDAAHVLKLETNFAKWAPLIRKCRDGILFVKEPRAIKNANSMVC